MFIAKKHYEGLLFFCGVVVLVAPVPGHCLPSTFHIRVLVVVPCGDPKKSPRISI